MILCVCPNPSVDMYAWVDTFKMGQVNRIKNEQRFPGGKGVHVALAAAELGEEVELLGFWGGPIGQWIRNMCEKYGISCHGPEIEDWSRTCLSFKSENGLNDTELLGCGPRVTGTDIEKFMESFENHITKADCVSMSGSWPEGAAEDGYARLIEKARQAGKKVFLDCTGQQFYNALNQRPYAVHLNQTEGEYFFKKKGPKQITQLLTKKCEYAAVTAGADGLYLATDTEFVHAKCVVDNVYSAVGSGDCLLAGLAVAFKRGMNITDAARLAVACGGANCIRHDLGMLYRNDVEMLQERAIVKTISSDQ